MKQLVEKKQSGCEISTVSRAKAGTPQLAGFAAVLSQAFDKLAGLSLVAIMVLVVANVLLRALFNNPILGTYEYVGFLTAAAIGLALANCAINNGHIAVDFLVEKLPAKLQAVINVIVNSISLVFWGITSWKLWEYAGSTANKGLVSPTTQTPIYPFIYLVSLGFLLLCFVMLVKLLESIKRAVKNE